MEHALDLTTFMTILFMSHTMLDTIVPTKSDSDVIFCLHLLLRLSYNRSCVLRDHASSEFLSGVALSQDEN